LRIVEVVGFRLQRKDLLELVKEIYVDGNLKDIELSKTVPLSYNYLGG